MYYHTHMAPRRFDVFMCHNSRDRTAVSHIGRRLLEQDLNPWLDQWNLVPGDCWQDAIEDALNRCSACAVFVGPSIGPWQHAEMRAAIDRRVAGDTQFRVIPVLLPGTPLPDKRSLPTFLRAYQWVEFSGPDDEVALYRLVCGIRREQPEDGGLRKQPQMAARISFEIALDGTFTAVNKRRVLLALKDLQCLLDDQTLTVKRIKAGSIVVELNGSQRGYEWFRHLFSTGQTPTIGGFPLKNVYKVKPGTDTDTAAEPRTRPAGTARQDFGHLVSALLSGGFFLAEAIEILEKSMIEGSLERCAGNRSTASRKLAIHRSTFQRKMDVYGVETGTGADAAKKSRARSTRTARRRGVKQKFDGLASYLLDGGFFLRQACELLEQIMVEAALEHSAGNKSAASKELGIHCSTLRRKVAEYGYGLGIPRDRRKPPIGSLHQRPRAAKLA